MPSRTKRKRYRRKVAKATAEGHHYAGGWGRGAEIGRGDLQLVRLAIRECWSVPATTCDDIVARLSELLDEPLTPENSRMQLAVCQTVVSMVGDNQRQFIEALAATPERDWPTSTPRPL